MAKVEEIIIQVRYKADGQKRTIAELKELVKEQKAAIENNISGSKEQADALKTLQAAQRVLSEESREYDKVLGKQLKSLGGINEQFDVNKATLGELLVEQKRLNKESVDFGEETPGFDEFAARLQLVNTRVRDLRANFKATGSTLKEQFQAAFEEANGTAGQSNDTIDGLNKQLKELKKEASSTSVGSERFQELANEIQKVDKELKDAKDAFKAVKPAAEEAATAGEKAASGISKAFAGIGTVIAGVFAADAIKGFVEGVAEATTEFQKLRTAIIQATGASGETLNQDSARLKAIADQFEVDQEELFFAVNQQAKTFGISFAESLKVVEKGLIAGANTNGEYITQLKEYTAGFKNAGGSAEEFTARIVDAQKKGTFDDKAADSFNEFTIKIGEATQSTRDALEGAFGKEFTEKILGGVKTGQLSLVEAQKLVSQQLKVSEVDAQEYATLVADVWGSPAENLSRSYIESLATVGETVDEVVALNGGLTESQRRLKEVQQAQIDANVELNKAYGELADAAGGVGGEFALLKTQAQALVVGALAQLVGAITAIPKFLKENKEELIALGVALAALNFGKIASGVTALTNAFKAQAVASRAAAAAQIAVNVALSANPIGVVVASLAALTAGVIFAYKQFDTFRATVKGLFEFFQGAFNTQLEFTKNAIGGLGDVIEGIVTFDFQKIKDGLKRGITDNISNAIANGKKAVKDGVDAYNDELLKVEIGKLGNVFTSGEAEKDAALAAKKAGEAAQKEADKQGKETGKKFNQAAADEFKKLQEAVGKLRLLARIELAGGKETLEGIAEVERQALAEQRKAEGFALLSAKEQEALLNVIRKDAAQQRTALRIKELQDLAKVETDTLALIQQQQELASQQALDNLDDEFAAALEAADKFGTARARVELQFAEERAALQEKALNDEEQLLNAQFTARINQAKELAAIEGRDPELEVLTIQAEQATALNALTRERIELQRELAQQATATQEVINTESIAFLQREIESLSDARDFERQREAIQELYDFEVELAGGNLVELERLDKERAERLRGSMQQELDGTKGFTNRLGKIKDLYDFEVAQAKGNAAKIEEIEAAKNQAILEEYDKLFEGIAAGYQKAGEIATTFNNLIAEQAIAKAEAAFEANEAEIERNDERLTQIEERQATATGRQAELLEQEKRDVLAQNQALVEANKKQNEEIEKQERRAALINKGLAIGQVIINTAQAITKSLAKTPLPAGLGFVIANAAIGAAQIATIAAQKFARGGVLKGPSHAEGGIPAVVDGRNVVELEGDEIILTKGVARDPRKRKIASDLNASAGGVRFAAGGLVAPSTVFTSVASQPVESQDLSEIVAAIGNITPVVRVSDINDVQGQVAQVEQRSQI